MPSWTGPGPGGGRRWRSRRGSCRSSGPWLHRSSSKKQEVFLQEVFFVVFEDAGNTPDAGITTAAPEIGRNRIAALDDVGSRQVKVEPGSPCQATRFFFRTTL